MRFVIGWGYEDESGFHLDVDLASGYSKNFSRGIINDPIKAERTNWTEAAKSNDWHFASAPNVVFQDIECRQPVGTTSNMWKENIMVTF